MLSARWKRLCADDGWTRLLITASSNMNIMRVGIKSVYKLWCKGSIKTRDKRTKGENSLVIWLMTLIKSSLSQHSLYSYFPPSKVVFDCSNCIFIEFCLKTVIPHILEQESFVQRGFERFIPHIIPHMILHLPLTSTLPWSLTATTDKVGFSSSFDAWMIECHIRHDQNPAVHY